MAGDDFKYRIAFGADGDFLLKFFQIDGKTAFDMAGRTILFDVKLTEDADPTTPEIVKTSGDVAEIEAVAGTTNQFTLKLLKTDTEPSNLAAGGEFPAYVRSSVGGKTFDHQRGKLEVLKGFRSQN